MCSREKTKPKHSGRRQNHFSLLPSFQIQEANPESGDAAGARGQAPGPGYDSWTEPVWEVPSHVVIKQCVGGRGVPAASPSLFSKDSSEARETNYGFA